MGINIEDLLAGVDPDSESKVNTTCTKLKPIIQNSLRRESRLIKRQEENGNRKDRENVHVPVLVKPGVPEHLRGWTLPNLDPLAALIAVHRPTIERTRQGLATVSELLRRVASLPGATELIGGRDEHIPPVRQLLDDLLGSGSGIRLTRAILGARGDALGKYIYRDLRPDRHKTEGVPRIELYWQMIGFFANQLDVAVEDLTIVVLSHEQAHAYTHLGHDANGCAWDLDSFDKSDPGLVEGLAQYYTARIVGSLRKGYPGAYEAYLHLLEDQDGQYLTHLDWLKSSTPEAVRLAMCRERSERVGKLGRFNDHLTKEPADHRDDQFVV